MSFIKPGVSELDLVAELEFFMKRNGSQGTAFDTLLISGPKTSLPHGTPSERKVQLGDFFTIDFGARFAFYCSDMTRTMVLGEPTDKQINIYNTVLEAQTQAMSHIKPGLSGKSIDSIARNFIQEMGFANISVMV